MRSLLVLEHFYNQFIIVGLRFIVYHFVIIYTLFLVKLWAVVHYSGDLDFGYKLVMISVINVFLINIYHRMADNVNTAEKDKEDSQEQQVSQTQT